MLHQFLMPKVRLFGCKSVIVRHRVLVFLSVLALLACACLVSTAPQALAQSSSGGVIRGTVVDPSGATVRAATVEIQDPITGFRREALTDAAGGFEFVGIPFNPYHLTVQAAGFQLYHQDVPVRTPVPITLKIALRISAVATTVTVHGEASDLIENTPLVHTDVSRQRLGTLPVPRQNTGLSTAITLSTPGVTADSNGMFHPMGEHADTTITIDGQPNSNQTSQIYSNQIPLDVIQSMEVVNGVAPAEDGDKTSLVVNTETRSELGLAKPHADLDGGYGSFGTWYENFTLGAGGAKWGNFLAANTSGTSRFMDSPEFTFMHDKGNNENIFDHIDYNPDSKDSAHLDIFLARTWFQVPNTYPQQTLGQDQRQQMYTLDLSPSWVRTISPRMLISVHPYFRQDYVRYYPSRNPFQDSPATVASARRMQTIGGIVSLDYANGIHNAKFGFAMTQTPLNENFRFGLTDPTFNPVCLTSAGAAVTTPSILTVNQCAPNGYVPNPGLLPGLVPYDLSRGGVPFAFRGHADIRTEAVYGQDSVHLGHLTLNGGLRGDFYNGITHRNALEPRAGISYLFKKTSTVFSASYGRFLETPYNENLVLSSETGAGGLATRVGAFGQEPLKAGIRNMFDLNIQQPIDHRVSVSIDQFWKYTSPDFDFDTIFNTPVVFPIEWQKSKIEGIAGTVTFPTYKGLTAYTTMGHVQARFFPPEIGGIIFNSPIDTGVFRIDHDENLNASSQVRYQFGKKYPWAAFTWRYDSGMVAGAVPDLASALALTADQQAQMGFYCGSVFATPNSPITSCSLPYPQYGATRINLVAPGTYNPDRNPTRVSPRNIFDVSVGQDSLFHTERMRVSLMFTVTNLANKEALYNFLSTFSGTHFVAPRAYQVQLGFHF